MTVMVRTADSRDIDVITAIYAHAVIHGSASFELEPPDSAEMTRRFRVLRDQSYPYLVAEREGLVLGFCYAGPFRSRPAYRATVEDSLYIAPDHQRSGIGRALLTSLIHACEWQGFRQMIAVIGDSGSLGSQHLHAALGFTPAGLLKATGWKQGRWLDTVLMQRPLGEGYDKPLEKQGFSDL
jgi:L-amino acid N-acyltransferase YncA